MKRFFPYENSKTQAVDKVALESAKMLQGFMRSLRNRNQLKLEATAGYDSRVLFLASLGPDCELYVTKLNSMSKDHPDLTISLKLASLFDKKLNVELFKEINPTVGFDNYINDIDFPFFKVNKSNSNSMYINGNISEIARNYYGYHNQLNASDLCYISGNGISKHVTRLYDNWLKNKILFTECGFHYLDMFYWEEKIGNWAAKGRTEAWALGYDIMSPFNSRALLGLLLSTKRKYRDTYLNLLYDKIILILSEGNKKILTIPINPSSLKEKILKLKKLKIYNLYMWMNIKLRRIIMV